MYSTAALNRGNFAQGPSGRALSIEDELGQATPPSWTGPEPRPICIIARGTGRPQWIVRPRLNCPRIDKDIT